MKNKLWITLLFLVSLTTAQVDVLFPSLDGVMIKSSLYEIKGDKILLLCHQARYSRGEYLETAPKFNALGYTCLAIDQRSGDSVNHIINQTSLNAKEMEKPTDYEDAEQDIKAAVYYLFEKYHKKITLLGSSYSSALVIKVAADESDKVERVISFSPGEYFKDEHIINTSLKKLDIPVWITCSKEEIKETSALFDGVLNKKCTFFKPTEVGVHGSRALWEKYKHNKEYWTALKDFLKTN